MRLLELQKGRKNYIHKEEKLQVMQKPGKTNDMTNEKLTKIGQPFYLLGTLHTKMYFMQTENEKNCTFLW